MNVGIFGIFLRGLALLGGNPNRLRLSGLQFGIYERGCSGFFGGRVVNPRPYDGESALRPNLILWASGPNRITIAPKIKTVVADMAIVCA